LDTGVAWRKGAWKEEEVQVFRKGQDGGVFTDENAKKAELLSSQKKAENGRAD